MNGSQTRGLQRPGTAARQSAAPADIKSLLNNEEQLPRLIIDHGYIDKLRTELTLRTSGFTVEQLEQINTHLMDCLWKKRGEWDRTKVAVSLQEEFNDVFQDMQQNQEFMSMSQPTKEQLTSRGVIAPQNLWFASHFDSILVLCGLLGLFFEELICSTVHLALLLLYLGGSRLHVCFVVVLC